MSKRQHYFDRIAEFKHRFANLPTEKLKERITTGSLYKEAAIAIREILQERDEMLFSKTTIFIFLLNEGVEVWRPVEAELIEDGIYKILSVNDDPDNEAWQFQTGMIVRCENKTFSDGETKLVAIESVEDLA
jgi:hypothetical protein